MVTMLKWFFHPLSLIDRRGIVVPDPTQNLPAGTVIQNGGENNAVNKGWHESYGATTTTQPQQVKVTQPLISH